MPDRIDWTPVKNAAGEMFPSFGLGIITGQDATTGALSIDTPDTDNDTGCIVLDAGAIPANGFGQGTFDPRVLVLYDEADGTPAAGDEWGVKAGNYRLRSGYTGFRILGGASGGLVYTLRVPPTGGAPTVTQVDSSGSPALSISADSTWQDVGGLTFTCPAAGTYQFITTVIGEIEISAGSGAFLYIQFAKNGTGVGFVGMPVNSISTTGVSFQGTSTITYSAILASSDVVKVQGLRSTGPTWTTSQIVSGILWTHQW